MPPRPARVAPVEHRRQMAVHEHVVCPFHQAEGGQWQEIAREPGVDAVDVHRGPSRCAGTLQGVAQPGVGMRRVDEPHERGSDDIGSGRKERRELFERHVGSRLGLRGVYDTVRPQADQCRHVVGSDDASGLGQAAQLRGITPDLGGTRRMDANELEPGPLDNGSQRVSTDVPGGELPHSQRHGALPMSRSVMALRPALYK